MHFLKKYLTCTILGLPVDKLRSKTKMAKKYFETKTLFKVTNLPIEVVHLVSTVGEPLR